MWSIPASARLVSISANPAIGGMFGREGLRIHAVFDLGEGAAAYRAAHRSADWSPLPLPAEVLGLDSGPKEVQAIPNSVFLLDVAPWAIVSEPPFGAYTPGSLPARIARYRIAVLDAQSGRLQTLYKAYY